MFSFEIHRSVSLYVQWSMFGMGQMFAHVSFSFVLSLANILFSFKCYQPMTNGPLILCLMCASVHSFTNSPIFRSNEVIYRYSGSNLIFFSHSCCWALHNIVKCIEAKSLCVCKFIRSIDVPLNYTKN